MLEPGAFEFHVQDAHYLRGYARAQHRGGEGAAEADISMFNDHAAGAITVERSLHDAFFASCRGERWPV